jgi:hypothetical protein
LQSVLKKYNRLSEQAVGPASPEGEFMAGQIIVGQGREIQSVSDADFVDAMNSLPTRMLKRLAFMSPDHHAVRDFVVRELPGQSRPLSP